MNKEQIINKIGEHLCDKTTGILLKKNSLGYGSTEQGKEFGSLVTLTYLQEKIFPLLDMLKKIN